MIWRQTVRSLKVASFVNELFLFIQFWYRNREGRRRRSNEQQTTLLWNTYKNGSDVKLWNIAHGRKLGIESLCLKPNAGLVLKHIYTCVVPTTYISDQSCVFCEFPYGYDSFANEDMIRFWGRKMIKQPSWLFIVMIAWSECLLGRQQYRSSGLFCCRAILERKHIMYWMSWVGLAFEMQMNSFIYKWLWEGVWRTFAHNLSRIISASLDGWI